MKSTIARQIKAELDKKSEQAKTLWGTFAADRQAAVDAGKNLADDKETFDTLHEKHAEYATVADEVAELTDRLVKALAMDGEGPELDDRKRGQELDRPEQKIWTPGQRLTESDAYKAWVEVNRQKLLSGAKQRNVEMPPIEYASREEFKALITGASDTSGGAFIRPDRQAQLYGLLTRPLSVRNLVTVGDTDSDVVEWVKETTYTNAAAETAEATAVAGTSGTKPESALAYDIVQSNVQTIAHWIPATKRALSDVGQLRTLIDARLEEGVDLRLDSQMVNGNGTGVNLTGILNQGIQAQAMGADPATEAILKAITLVRLAFLEPDAVLMNPSDFLDVRLAKNGNGDYYYGPPNMAGPQQIWGLPIVLSTVVAAGTAIVGKWDEAILWVREGVTLSATDSHSDFFVRNMVAILAEGRFAFAVPRPAAFCAVTGI